MIPLPWRWSVVPLTELAVRVVALAGDARPAVVAMDGHSSSGKTTLSGRLAAALPSAAVLHTDDLAWHHGVFAWDTVLLDDVLPVVRSGAALDYRPPGWVARERPGSVTLPGGLAYLVVEGVGASQPSVRSVAAVTIWVETDEPTRMARDLPRVAAGDISPASYASWMTEEYAYTTVDRPWEHADLVVHGGERLDHDPETEVVLRA